LTAVPGDAHYDSATRRLQWALDKLEPGRPLKFGFEVRMGGIGFYQVLAEARGEGSLQAREKCNTDVAGLPDVDLVVSERRRVVDVGGKTTFQIRLRNYGTKEATNLLLSAQLSKNLKVTGSASPDGIQVLARDDMVTFLDAEGRGIPTLGPQKEILLGIVVEVTGIEPKLATCRVKVTHDDLSEPFEDMAGVKVMTSRRAASSVP
jgi:uncharacterized repeat protein (TIGR01451 family)